MATIVQLPLDDQFVKVLREGALTICRFAYLHPREQLTRSTCRGVAVSLGGGQNLSNSFMEGSFANPRFGRDDSISICN